MSKAWSGYLLHDHGLDHGHAEYAVQAEYAEYANANDVTKYAEHAEYAEYASANDVTEYAEYLVFSLFNF